METQSNALQVRESFVPLAQAEIDKLVSMSPAPGLITTKETRESAEKFLKDAKLVLKTTAENRLFFTRKLDDIKKQAMAPEKQIEDLLKPIEEAITKQLKTEDAEAKRLKQEAERKAEEERRQKQAILDAETGAKSMIAEFTATVTRKIATAPDNATLDVLAKQVRGAKPTISELVPDPAPYQEQFEEQKVILLKLISKAKKDESVKEQAAAKAEVAEAKLDSIQDEAQEKSLDIAMAADNQVQASKQSIGVVSGVRNVWEFEIVDLTQVPVEYLIVNEAAVKAAIKEGVREIPGLNIHQTVGRSGR